MLTTPKLLVSRTNPPYRFTGWRAKMFVQSLQQSGGQRNTKSDVDAEEPAIPSGTLNSSFTLWGLANTPDTNVNLHELPRGHARMHMKTRAQRGKKGRKTFCLFSYTREILTSHSCVHLFEYSYEYCFLYKNSLISPFACKMCLAISFNSCLMLARTCMCRHENTTSCMSESNHT